MEVERRSLLKGLAAGFTGAVVTPAPADALAHAPDTPGPESSQPSAPPATPAAAAGLLDDHQRRTLASLADLILPGSVAAGTIDLLDRVAAVDSSAAQRRLLNAIARFDQEARDLSGARWLDLPETTRLEILTRAATETSGPPAVPVTLATHLDDLKAAVGAAYASTETGMKALGWAGRSSWRELPGCTPPEPAHE